MSDKVYGLFPTPIWVTKIDRELIKGETDFIFAQEKETNGNNECSINKRVLDHHFLSKLRNEITQEISQYINSVICPKNKIELYFTQSWINFNKAGQSHFQHDHPNSFLSGVYYINAIKDKDRITFRKREYSTIEVYSQAHNPFNSNEWDIPVESGTLIIFPSNLLHKVSELEKDYEGTRISLSFNTFISGNIGNDSAAMGLHLN